MSYDVYLRPTCAKCGEVLRHLSFPECPDPTYNLTPIFDFALTGKPYPNPSMSEFESVVLGKETDRPRGLRVLDGKRAGETVPMLEQALGRLRDPSMRARFLELEPENKWGTLSDACFVIERLLLLATEHRFHIWEVH